MAHENQTDSNPRARMPVLLVIIGGLGDWCIRRVLKHARLFEAESKIPIKVVVLDVQPREDIDKWIVRRLIEQSAEDADAPLRDEDGRLVKRIDWDFTGRLATNPALPDPTAPGGSGPDRAIEQFIEGLGPVFRAAYDGDRGTLESEVRSRISGYLEGIGEEQAAARVKHFVTQIEQRAKKVKERFSTERESLREWLLGATSLEGYGEIPRYCPEADDETLRALAGEYRIIVYVATPPDKYPKLLQRWSAYAERIALEKPVAGLLEDASETHYRLTRPVGAAAVQTTQAIRQALEEECNNQGRIAGLPPLEIVTVDHYNTKWAVVAIEWLRRRRVADHILARPRRVCIEALEGGLLPRGRFGFYNGVGALADMIAHLIQPLRALTGHSTVKDLLSVLRIVRIRRARYDLPANLARDAFGAGGVAKSDLSGMLARDTETFGVIELQFIGPPWNGTPVYIRTGKGILPQSKTITVEGFDDDGPAALICDIENRHIRLAVPAPQIGAQAAAGQVSPASPVGLPDRVWMQTQEIEIPGLVSSRPLRARADEYLEVFTALCDWESPDPRFFPPVEEATHACDFFYRELLRDRAAFPRGLDGDNVYQADYLGEKVRAWLAAAAGWK